MEAPVVEVQEGARSARCHARAGCWTFGWHHFERTQTLEAEGEGEILTGGVGGVGGAVVVCGLRGEERGEIWRIQHNFSRVIVSLL